MSQENVELLRRLYASGDFDRFGLESLLLPDSEFMPSLGAVGKEFLLQN
jgi:hypothetical protein